MRVSVASDLHLEFGNIVLKNTENADVLILSGDICVANAFSRKPEFLKFFEQVCSEFKEVLYVMGNHEHYDGDFATSKDNLQEHLSHLKNLHILEKETFQLGEYTFVGGTLWTDMNGEDPMTLHAIGSMMNDFRCVKNSNKKVSFRDSDGNFHERTAKFSPEDAVEDHKKMIDYIHHVVRGKDNQKFVVVGHHAPSKLSTHPRYQNETLMNGGYSSDLSQFILDNPQIKLWTHGHTHETFDYNIGTTRIVCNPRGYINYENRAEEFELRFIDL